MNVLKFLPHLLKFSLRKAEHKNEKTHQRRRKINSNFMIFDKGAKLWRLEIYSSYLTSSSRVNSSWNL
jgi:hypothetical protein